MAKKTPTPRRQPKLRNGRNGVRRRATPAPTAATLPQQSVSPAGSPQAVPSFRRLLYMYGAVTQIELNSFLLGNSIDGEERYAALKRTKW